VSNTLGRGSLEGPYEKVFHPRLSAFICGCSHGQEAAASATPVWLRVRPAVTSESQRLTSDRLRLHWRQKAVLSTTALQTLLLAGFIVAIAVRCGSCGQSYNLADQMAGQAVRCTTCRAVIPVPHPQPATIGAGPQYGLLPPVDHTGFGAPSPILRPASRRKKGVSPMIFVGLGVAGFAVLAMVVLVVIVARGFILKTGSAVAKAVSPPAHSEPVVLSSSYRPASFTPNPGTVTPAGTPAMNGSPAPSAAEDVIKRLLASLNELNGLMAQVVDRASAERLRNQVPAKIREFLNLARELEVVARNLSAAEDRRLESLYMAQLKSGVEQLKNQALRIQALGRQLQFDAFNRQMEELNARTREMGRVAQPAQPPTFQPPTFQPPNIQPPTFNPPTVHPPTAPRRPPNPGMPNGIRPPSVPRRFGR
jgi:hypothetical protein